MAVNAGVSNGAALRVCLGAKQFGLELGEVVAAVAARRVFGGQPARCLPAAQGRDGHAQQRSGFTYADQSLHFVDIRIDMGRFNSICSSPSKRKKVKSPTIQSVQTQKYVIGSAPCMHMQHVCMWQDSNRYAPPVLYASPSLQKHSTAESELNCLFAIMPFAVNRA